MIVYIKNLTIITTLSNHLYFLYLTKFYYIYKSLINFK